MKKIRVLIVDDSFTVRQALAEILASDPELEIVGTAGDAMAAAEKIGEDPPDVITLDIEMPHMDGLTFLHMIMSLRPIPVVICSSQVDRPKNAMLALEYGAVEVILKPQSNLRNFFEESRIILCDAVKAAARANLKKRKPVRTEISRSEKLLAPAVLPAGSTRSVPAASSQRVVVIGSSTGGTDALRVLLKNLPPNAPGIVIVQHMPEHFTRGFAERLDSICSLSVREAENNDPVEQGHVLVAPGNRHILLKRGINGYYVEVKEGPLVSRHRPSVDVLFRSAARYAGKDAIGVILTGMGDDGAAGMREMKDAGSYTIAQDEASCVIFGMPQEAIKQGGVTTVLPLEAIGRKMLEVSQQSDEQKR